MKSWTTVLIGCLITLGAAVLRAEDDPIKTDLDKAKSEYEAVVQRRDTVVAAFFARAEEVARVDKDKKQLNEIVADRQVFDETHKMPKYASDVVRKEFDNVKTARDMLVKAFKTAEFDFCTF